MLIISEKIKLRHLLRQSLKCTKYQTWKQTRISAYNVCDLGNLTLLCLSFLHYKMVTRQYKSLPTRAV